MRTASPIKKGKIMESNITRIIFDLGGKNGLRFKRAIDSFCKRHDLAPIRHEIAFSQAAEELERVKTIKAALRTSPRFTGGSRKRHLVYLGKIIEQLEGVVKTVPEIGDREARRRTVEELGGTIEEVRGPAELGIMKPPEKE